MDRPSYHQIHPRPRIWVYKIISALWLPILGTVSSAITLVLLSLIRTDSGSSARLSYLPVYVAAVGYILSSSLGSIVRVVLYQTLWSRLSAQSDTSRGKHEGMSLRELKALHTESRLSLKILLRPALSLSWLGSILTQLFCLSIHPLVQYGFLAKTKGADGDAMTPAGQVWVVYFLVGISFLALILSFLYLLFAPNLLPACLIRDTLLDTLSVRQEEPIWKHTNLRFDEQDIRLAAVVQETSLQGRKVPVLSLALHRASDVELGDNPGLSKRNALSTLLRRTSSQIPDPEGLSAQGKQSEGHLPSISPQSSIHYHAPDDFDNAARQYRIYSMPEVDIGVSQDQPSHQRADSGQVQQFTS
jgi:hypothetical protein